MEDFASRERNVTYTIINLNITLLLLEEKFTGNIKLLSKMNSENIEKNVADATIENVCAQNEAIPVRDINLDKPVTIL